MVLVVFIQLVICSLIVTDPQRLRLQMSERAPGRCSLSRPGGEGEEARRAPGPGLGLGETNVRPRDHVGLCSNNLAIDRVSILEALLNS